MESSPPVPSLYRIRSVHVAEKLRLKDLRERLPGVPLEFSNHEMVLQDGPESYAFFYNYGSVVFFNMTDEAQEKVLTALQEFRPSTSVGRTSDAFLLEVQATPPAPSEVSKRVLYDRLVVDKLTYPKIKIACMLIAESTGLEYYEILTEGLLERAGVFTKRLERQGQFLESSEDLIKFIGMCLNTKQEIISNLYIVDSPEETWESAELDKLFQELKIMFEIDTRYRALDYKIKIIQESLEIIVDLAKTRRETKLELIIILLIAFEVALSVIKAAGWA